MTVEEIIEHEGRSGHLCLMLQGMFMRAYNGSGPDACSPDRLPAQTTQPVE